MPDDEATQSGLESTGEQVVDQVIEASLGRLKRKSPVTTGGRREFRLIRPTVKVVEMEDVLFHFNSCVLMPSAPEGESSTEGAADRTEEEQERADLQKRVTGLHALALTYKVLDEHNTLAILIAGHTDTSGGTAGNFVLSDQRANNVLFLLEQRREDWANLCYERHRVEDYQQILKHYAEKNPEWECDPGDIDNDYGDDTHTASENYFSNNGLDPNLANKAKFDGQHRWPVEAWLVTYDLYDKEIDEILEKASGIPLEQRGPKKVQTCHLAGRENDDPKPRNARLRFADTARKILGCGESFPIQASLKDNYKSQENRRVEILFFNLGDLPDFLLPEDRNKKLVGDDVPIFTPFFYEHIYVDPFDIFAVTYHLRFVYYDRFTKKIEPVPGGLTITALDEKNEPLKSKTEYDNDNYVIKVADDENRKTIRFEFETTNLWIEMNIHGGIFVNRDPAGVRALPLAERVKYYDLPAEWSSQNYWTRHGGSLESGDRFETVMEMRLSLKPYGNKRTTPKQPLVFSLDDIVLVDEKGSQVITDRTPFNGKLKLSKESRFALFHISDYKLQHFDSDPNDPQFTLQRLEENLIHKTPVEGRLIIFANSFYDIWDKRAGQSGDPFNAAIDVKGCRAARQNDRDCRFTESVNAARTGVDKHHPYHSADAGNFDLHYIHTGCYVPGTSSGLTRAFLMIYWSARFKAHFHTGKDADKKGKVTKAELKTFANEGFRNAKERWEMKEYWIEPQQPKEGQSFEIVPFYWFDPKDDKRGGPHKCMVSVSNNTKVGEMGVTESQMYREDYKTRSDTDGGTVHEDEHDKLKAANLVLAHEIGHAMGQPDEYRYREDPYDQHLAGAPLAGFFFTIMNSTMAFPRLRNIWNFINWLNDTAAASGKLKEKLDSQKFRGTYWISTNPKDIYEIRELNYFLDDQFRNIYVPFRAEKKLALKTGSVKMDLYAWGEDETAITPKMKSKLPPFAYGGRLAIFYRLGYRFINNPKNPSEKWDDDSKQAFRRAIRGEVASLRDKSYLNLPQSGFRSGNDGIIDKQFQNTSLGYISQDAENQPTSKTDFDITAILRHDAKITKRSGKRLEVGDEISPRWIAKYLLGEDDGATEAPISATDPDIDTMKIEFVRDWVRTQLGNNNFVLRDEYDSAPFA